MSRRFSTKVVLFLIFLIPVLFILGKATELQVIGQSMDVFAGILSIALGTFIFIQVKTLDRPTNMKRTLLEIILILGGVLILVPQIYAYLKALNNLLESLIVIGYLLLLLLAAFFTKNEHVSSGQVRSAKRMLGEDISDDPRFKKMMRRR